MQFFMREYVPTCIYFVAKNPSHEYTHGIGSRGSDRRTLLVSKSHVVRDLPVF